MQHAWTHSSLPSQSRQARLDELNQANKTRRNRLAEKNNLKRSRTREHTENSDLKITGVEIDKLKKQTHKLRELAFKKRGEVLAKKAETRAVNKLLADLTVYTRALSSHHSPTAFFWAMVFTCSDAFALTGCPEQCTNL